MSMEENTNEMVQISIDEVIRAKSEKLYRMLPRFITRYLCRIIHQDEINDILRRYHGESGIEFANGVMNEFNVRFDVHHQQRIPASGRFIVACNHPLGGFDGLALISLLSQYRHDIIFPVNDFLMHIPNLKDIFVPINKVGHNSIALARRFDEVFDSDKLILYFPAGICSRKIDGKIQDVAWKKTFISKAKEFHRDILPIYFEGKNSNFFYNLAALRKKLGIKVNIEMVYLADEFFKQRHSAYSIYIGEPVSYETFTQDKSDFQWAQQIRRYVYTLATQDAEEYKSIQ